MFLFSSVRKLSTLRIATSYFPPKPKLKRFPGYLLTNKEDSSFITMDIPPSSSRIPILYEDEHMIVLNKPENMRSVPGVEVHYMKHYKPRGEEWSDAVKLVAKNYKGDDDLYKEVIDALANLQNLPRKPDTFCAFMKRRFKIQNENFIMSVHHDILTVDKQLHVTDFADIPEHLVAASDIAEQMTGGKIYVVHRLDMETSGIILFARSQNICQELGRQFREREVHKTYIAKVAHSVDKSIATIDAPLGADLNNRPYQKVDHNLGKESLTYVRVIDSLHDEQEYRECYALFPEHTLSKVTSCNNEVHSNNGTTVVDASISNDTAVTARVPISGSDSDKRDDSNVDSNGSSSNSNNTQSPTSNIHWRKLKADDDKQNNTASVDASLPLTTTTLVELKPHTGRTHQLRVHMAHIGHPILGDSLYATGDLRSASTRLCLHAKAITFRHPFTGVPMEIDTVKRTLKRKATIEDNVVLENEKVGL